MHVNANPTQGQLLHSQYIKKKEELKDTTKVSILAKYGGEEYLEKAPKELLQGQTEEYVEYSRTGQVIKGNERAKVRSKYPEDGASITLSSTCVGHSPFFSVREQPHSCVGLVVRRRDEHMGLRLLSLIRAYVVLYWRGRYSCCTSIQREEPSGILFNTRTVIVHATPTSPGGQRGGPQEKGRGTLLETTVRRGRGVD